MCWATSFVTIKLLYLIKGPECLPSLKTSLKALAFRFLSLIDKEQSVVQLGYCLLNLSQQISTFEKIHALFSEFIFLSLKKKTNASMQYSVEFIIINMKQDLENWFKIRKQS